MKYKKEAEVVDAYQTVGPVVGAPEWLLKAIEDKVVTFDAKGRGLDVLTLSGRMLAPWGHWIVRYESGVLNILPDCYFTKTYKPVDG